VNAELPAVNVAEEGRADIDRRRRRRRRRRRGLSQLTVNVTASAAAAAAAAATDSTVRDVVKISGLKKSNMVTVDVVIIPFIMC